MKSLQVISALPSSSERRARQRRMSIARRIQPDRRSTEILERPAVSDRRGSGNRRRRPDRRIGLSPDLDLYRIGI